MKTTKTGISRRRFLRDAALGAAFAAGGSLLPRKAWATSRRQTAAVFGGGIAGLTAAHELAERGFDVTVFERRAWGGKARSTEVPGSATGGRKPLPGEHGLRLFFGLYHNTMDTFRRIPFESNPNGVFDNLASFSNFLVARDGDRRDILLPLGGTSERMRVTPQVVIDTIVGLLLRETYLPPEAVAFFAQRMLVFLSSCDARRIGQWENVKWTDFAGADRFNDDYRKIIIKTFSELVQASKAERTSASFCATCFEWVIHALLHRHTTGPVFQMLNLPANEALFDPWVTLLRDLGVNLQLGYAVEELACRGGSIAGATVRGPAGVRSVTADWYVCALPVERARALWNPAILAADPHLGRMFNLDIGWMNGMKFFFRRRLPIFNGAIDFVDAPWLMAGLTQAQFWPVDFASTYGDGSVQDCFSLFIANWATPGSFIKKRADECSEEEIAVEVWEQMKRHLNDSRRTILTDDLLHSWDIDAGMLRQNGRLVSDDPLVLPSAGQRADRPDVATAIPNLFLAGDYLKSNWLVANMESASYNARRAVAALLESAGSRETPPARIEPIRPPEWEPLKKIDERLWHAGQPNLFDAEIGLSLQKLQTTGFSGLQ